MPQPFTVVLGTAQDGGVPHIGCTRACCADAWNDPARRRLAACLAIVDPDAGERWIIDCTPDFREQLRILNETAPTDTPNELTGILLTHAHIGHYTGLLSLGREALNAKRVSVFAMPRMLEFLRGNEPWRQLAQQEHIVLHPLHDGVTLALNDRVSVTPWEVPHRGELSETVGFQISGPGRTVLYVPDVDDWDGCNPPIEVRIAESDAAYLDGTFYSDEELAHRSIAEVPHPRIASSLDRFGALSESHRSRVRFIHFNHTNPVFAPNSAAAQAVAEAGMHLADRGERLEL